MGQVLHGNPTTTYSTKKRNARSTEGRDDLCVIEAPWDIHPDLNKWRIRPAVRFAEPSFQELESHRRSGLRYVSVGSETVVKRLLEQLPI